MKGRKRHLLVDTQEFLIKTVVYPADLADRDGGKLVLATLAPGAGALAAPAPSVCG